MRSDVPEQLSSVRDEAGRKLRDASKISEEVNRFFKNFTIQKENASEYIQTRIMNLN